MMMIITTFTTPDSLIIVTILTICISYVFYVTPCSSIELNYSKPDVGKKNQKKAAKIDTDTHVLSCMPSLYTDYKLANNEQKNVVNSTYILK